MSRMLGNSANGMFLAMTLAALVMVISGCGGGGGSSGSNPTATLSESSSSEDDDTDKWVAGQFEPADTFEDRCPEPRTGIDPETGQPFPDQPGTFVDENNWLRSWSNDLYLWYDEIIDQNPADFDTPEYFDLLKTEEKTPSDNPKDRFHFMMPTEQWRAVSQSAVSAGYGVQWAVLSASPPRKVVVAYIEDPDSPATTDGVELSRGA